MLHEFVLSAFEGVAFALGVWALVGVVCAIVAPRAERDGMRPPPQRVAIEPWAPRRFTPPQRPARLAARLTTRAGARRVAARPGRIR